MFWVEIIDKKVINSSHLVRLVIVKMIVTISYWNVKFKGTWPKRLGIIWPCPKCTLSNLKWQCEGRRSPISYELIKEAWNNLHTRNHTHKHTTHTHASRINPSPFMSHASASELDYYWCKNCLSPVRHQTIIPINHDFWSITTPKEQTSMKTSSN